MSSEISDEQFFADLDELSDEQVAELLAQPDNLKGPKKDPTEPRIAATWFKLTVDIEHTCDNPDCSDPRPAGDRGRLTTVMIKSSFMCRYCFLAGWLSDG